MEDIMEIGMAIIILLVPAVIAVLVTILRENAEQKK
jgi:hypothetical protein